EGRARRTRVTDKVTVNGLGLADCQIAKVAGRRQAIPESGAVGDCNILEVVLTVIGHSNADRVWSVTEQVHASTRGLRNDDAIRDDLHFASNADGLDGDIVRVSSADVGRACGCLANRGGGD